MFPYLVITDVCTACDNCSIICPENAVLKIEGVYSIETYACTLCSACMELCPMECIKLKDKPQSLIG